MSRSAPWVLVIVRAWLEEEGTRIRLLRNDSDGEQAERTAGTPHHAALVVEDWIEQLRRDPRRTGDAGVDETSLDSPGDHRRNHDQSVRRRDPDGP